MRMAHSPLGEYSNTFVPNEGQPPWYHLPMQRLLTGLAILLSIAGCLHLAPKIAVNRFPAPAAMVPDALATPSIAAQNAAWCAANPCPPLTGAPVHTLLDLHAHLSMKPGLYWVFSGVPWALEHEPDWSHRFSEKMAVEAVRKSGMKLIVVSLYANPFFTFPQDPAEAIYEELAQTRELVARYPDDFSIATTSEQARRIIAGGKIALLLALEAAEWSMRTPEDVAALYREGVRMVNPIHLYDSWIGGSDLQGTARAFINPPGYGHAHWVDDHRENNLGLTENGRNLLRTFAQYGIVIDISHFSRQSLRDLAAMRELAHLPIVNSHMPNLVDTADNERAVDAYTFRLLAERGGLLGLVPTTESPVGKDPYPGLCRGTVETYARTYAAAVSRAAGMPIAMASDFNGGIGHLRPTHGSDGCRPLMEAKTDFDRHGLRDAGFLPDLVAAMRARGADPEPMFTASERLLQILARAEAAKTR